MASVSAPYSEAAVRVSSPTGSIIGTGGGPYGCWKEPCRGGLDVNRGTFRELLPAPVPELPICCGVGDKSGNGIAPTFPAGGPAWLENPPPLAGALAWLTPSRLPPGAPAIVDQMPPPAGAPAWLGSKRPPAGAPAWLGPWDSKRLPAGAPAWLGA